MSHPLFSVISPIFNVEATFLQGVQQILKQDFTDFEYILVDDGSTDKSGSMCDEVAKKDKRVKVFHKKNEGVGSARNIGIGNATGKYICFFDVDDSLEASALRTIASHVNKDSSLDMLIFSYDSYDVRYKTLSNTIFTPRELCTPCEIRSAYVDCLLGIYAQNGFVWNKAYSTAFLKKHNLQFKPLRIQQDEVFNLEAYAQAQHIRIVSNVLYHYFVYDKGNIRSHFIADRLNIYIQVKNAFLHLYNFWRLNDPRMLKYVYLRFFNSVVFTLNYNCYHSSSKQNTQQRDHDISFIMQSNDTIDCLAHMRELQIIPRKFFARLFFIAIENHNITLFKLIHYAQHAYDTVKWNLKKRTR